MKSPRADLVIYTIGHSTRPLDEFVALLTAHRVEQLADIRTVPKSRRHPQFVGEALAESLPCAGVAYRHMPGLGGLRKPRTDSTNTAWQNASFRGYADYMQTPPFERALDELLEWAETAAPRRPVLDMHERDGASASVRGGGAPRTVIMCAEAVWWRCHRRLVADALVARGIEVRHITSASRPESHTLTEFARLDGARVTYPGLFL